MKNIIIGTCKEAEKLMSLKRDRPLTFREALRLNVHLLACGACRKASKNYDAIKAALSQNTADIFDQKASLSDEAKVMLQEKLAQAQKAS